MTNQDNNHQLNHRIYHFEKIYKAIKHVIVFIFMIFIAIVAIAVIAMSLYFHHLTKTSDSLSDDALIKKVRQIPGDELLDHNNKNLLYEYNHSQNSLIIGPKTSSPNVIKALTSSEDTLFYKHDGILPKAILRAMIQDIFNTDQSSGGSTITQQLVKNQVLTNEKTYSRKANELRLAIRLEHLLSKDEIIYTYLNIVPFVEIIMALIFPELHPLHIVCLVFHQKIYQLHNLHTLSVCCKALMAIHPTKKMER